jgi:DNA modification methylase
MTTRIITGDCRDVLATIPAESVHCVVTSPPYWGLRNYGVAGQMGLESTIEGYVNGMVEVFRAVRRVLRKDGTLWLNLGDSFATGDGKVGDRPGGGAQGDSWAGYKGDRNGHEGKHAYIGARGIGPMTSPNRMPQAGLKPKDLCGIPWRVAFALQADGWWLRQDIIWSKPNPMPESVTDRCTKSHEYLFLLSKSERYYYDAEAIKEGAVAENDHDLTDLGMFAPGQTAQRGNRKIKMPDGWDTGPGSHGSFHRHGREKGRTRGRASGNKTHKGVTEYEVSESEEHRTKAGLLKISETAYALRNKRSVWEIATSPYPEAHFATFPPALVEPCILAGCPKDGTVLDPFGGAGTTGLVADRLQRNAILIELSPAYVAMAGKRIHDDAPLFAISEVAE